MQNPRSEDRTSRKSSGSNRNESLSNRTGQSSLVHFSEVNFVLDSKSILRSKPSDVRSDSDSEETESQRNQTQWKEAAKSSFGDQENVDESKSNRKKDDNKNFRTSSRNPISSSHEYSLNVPTRTTRKYSSSSRRHSSDSDSVERTTSRSGRGSSRYSRDSDSEHSLGSRLYSRSSSRSRSPSPGRSHSRSQSSTSTSRRYESQSSKSNSKYSSHERNRENEDRSSRSSISNNNDKQHKSTPQNQSKQHRTSSSSSRYSPIDSPLSNDSYSPSASPSSSSSSSSSPSPSPRSIRRFSFDRSESPSDSSSRGSSSSPSSVSSTSPSASPSSSNLSYSPSLLTSSSVTKTISRDKQEKNEREKKNSIHKSNVKSKHNDSFSEDDSEDSRTKSRNIQSSKQQQPPQEQQHSTSRKSSTIKKGWNNKDDDEELEGYKPFRKLVEEAESRGETLPRRTARYQEEEDEEGVELRRRGLSAGREKTSNNSNSNRRKGGEVEEEESRISRKSHEKDRGRERDRERDRENDRDRGKMKEDLKKSQKKSIQIEGSHKGSIDSIEYRSRVDNDIKNQSPSSSSPSSSSPSSSSHRFIQGKRPSVNPAVPMDVLLTKMLHAERSFCIVAHETGLNTHYVRCKILRDRSSLQARLYPTYELFLEDNNKPILRAQKMKLNRTSNYHIFDLSGNRPYRDLSKYSSNYLGKLRATTSSNNEYSLINHPNFNPPFLPFFSSSYSDSNSSASSSSSSPTSSSPTSSSSSSSPSFTPSRSTNGSPFSSSSSSSSIPNNNNNYTHHLSDYKQEIAGISIQTTSLYDTQKRTNVITRQLNVLLSPLGEDFVHIPNYFETNKYGTYTEMLKNYQFQSYIHENHSESKGTYLFESKDLMGSTSSTCTGSNSQHTTKEGEEEEELVTEGGRGRRSPRYSEWKDRPSLVASVKNFQLILKLPLTQHQQQEQRHSNLDDIYVQFLKIGIDTYALDFRAPFSPFVAFALALCQFDQ